MSEQTYPIVNPMNRGRQCKCKECDLNIGPNGNRFWYQPSSDKSSGKVICTVCAKNKGWDGVEDKPMDKPSKANSTSELLGEINAKLDRLLAVLCPSDNPPAAGGSGRNYNVLRLIYGKSKTDAELDALEDASAGLFE